MAGRAALKNIYQLYEVDFFILIMHHFISVHEIVEIIIVFLFKKKRKAAFLLKDIDLNTNLLVRGLKKCC